MLIRIKKITYFRNCNVTPYTRLWPKHHFSLTQLYGKSEDAAYLLNCLPSP